MATTVLTKDNFEATVDKPGIVFIDWWAPWCGPCKGFAPIYEQSSERHSDVTFAKINTDEQAELAGAFQIMAIPTLTVFRDGIVVFSQPGVVPGGALDELVAKVKELDMDEVRRQVAEAEASEPPAEHFKDEEEA